MSRWRVVDGDRTAWQEQEARDKKMLHGAGATAFSVFTSLN